MEKKTVKDIFPKLFKKNKGYRSVLVLLVLVLDFF